MRLLFPRLVHDHHFRTSESESVFIRTTISLFLAGIPCWATQLLAKIQESFGIELQLRALFDHPTVAAISAEIDRNLAARRPSRQNGPALEYQTDSDSRVE